MKFQRCILVFRDINDKFTKIRSNELICTFNICYKKYQRISRHFLYVVCNQIKNFGLFPGSRNFYSFYQSPIGIIGNTFKNWSFTLINSTWFYQWSLPGTTIECETKWHIIQIGAIKGKRFRDVRENLKSHKDPQFINNQKLDKKLRK